MNHLQERKAAGEIVTGLLYLDPEPTDLHSSIGTVALPLNYAQRLKVANIDRDTPMGPKSGAGCASH